MSVRILISFLFLFLSIPTAMADDILFTNELAIYIDQQTGKINQVRVANVQGKGRTEFSPVISNGDLLSLGLVQQATLISQQLLSDDVGVSVVESHYVLNSEISVVREVRPGTAPYSISLSYEISNPSTEVKDLPVMEQAFITFGEGFERLTDPGGGYGATIYAYRDLFLSQKDIAGRVEEFQEDSLDKTSVDWLGWVNRYYVIAVRGADQNSSLGLDLAKIDSDNERPSPTEQKILIQENDSSGAKSLLPGQSLFYHFESVIAPKQWGVLSQVQPALEGVVQIHLWGWLRNICAVIWSFIEGLFKLTGNWGLTIILLALLVRLITIPVTRLSLRFQKKAALQQERIAPLVKGVKEKYKGIELSEQMVALYQREKFDQLAPFKGMLGLFIQIPIFIALFNILGEAPELSGAPFLWIDDLALSDRLFPLGITLPFFGGYFNLLPFLMVLVTILSTYHAVKNSDDGKTSAITLFGMAAVFFILFYSFPAAMVLYWFCSNLFQLLQQMIEHKFIGA